MRQIWTFGLFALILIFMSNCSASVDKNNDSQYWQEIQKNYHIYAPPLPHELDFAGEKVPLQYFDVRESLDREILKAMFWHSETILYIKRAPRFFPIVEPILKKYGIPDDFKYLLVAESGMANVVSPAGASGYWQFMEKTAKKYGLIVNDQVDQRYDIYLSTEAACKYLRDAYKHYGSWTLAAAAYNVGQTNLDRAIARQGSNNFYDLALNVQTARYIYRILAYKIILSQPEKYGFYVRDKDKYYPIKTKIVKVNTSVPSWIDFAKQYGTNYKILLLLNPWIRSNKLDNPENHTFYVRIPEKGARIVKH
jgi:hypothetical protein